MTAVKILKLQYNYEERFVLIATSKMLKQKPY